MFNFIIRTSIAYRHLVLSLSLLLAIVGAVSYKRLIIDAVPDITNIQIQINSEAQGYSLLRLSNVLPPRLNSLFLVFQHLIIRAPSLATACRR